jgi:hypothetical protein
MKPQRQKRAGVFERCSDTRVSVVAAPLASVGTATCDPVELGSDYTATRAGRVITITTLHDAIQASIIVWVLGLELLKGVFHDGMALV